MIRPEARPVIASEKKVTGRFMMANHEADTVHIQSEEIGEDAHRYTVTGEIALERPAIAAIMATPLGLPDSTWTEVRDGLRDVAYPSKKVKGLARGALASDLRMVGPASRQLAKQLTDNQDQKSQTVNLPVYTYFESYASTAHDIRTSLESRKLLSYLKGIGIDQGLADNLRRMTVGVSPESGGAAELRQLVNMSDNELLLLFNQAILESVDGRIEAELIHRLQELSFSGFRQQAQFANSQLQGGGPEYEIYLRNKDIPDDVASRLDATKVFIGALLRDRDRKTGQVRRKVTFSTQTPRVVAYPQLTWENHGGRRMLRFPVNPYQQERPYGESKLVRPSSIVGAALLINFLADLKGIDYGSALASRARYFLRTQGLNLKKHDMNLPWAGFLPIVMTHRQSELLDDDYFDAVEEHAVQ